MQHYVVGFVFDQTKDLVLLIQKTKPDWQAGYLNGIGGKVEDYDQTIHHAMSRECEEESGLKTFPGRWHHVGKIVKENEFQTEVFYTTHSDILQARTMEEEIVSVYSIRQIILGREKTIENIPMLIQYCQMHKNNDVLFAPTFTMNYPVIR